MPDSFGSRGEGSQCRETRRVARASSERIDDVLAAKAYLQSRSDVKADAVSLLGWSNGGSTVLYTLREIAGMQDGEPPFAKAVAFYPGCRTPLQKGGWKTATPLLILIGEADDWTPMQPCKDLAEQARGTGGALVSIVTYPAPITISIIPRSRCTAMTGWPIPAPAAAAPMRSTRAGIPGALYRLRQRQRPQRHRPGGAGFARCKAPSPGAAALTRGGLRFFANAPRMETSLLRKRQHSA